MASEWVAFVRAVLRFWGAVSVEAFRKALAFIGQTKEGIIFSCLVLVVFALFLLLRHGWRGMREKIWEKALEGVAVAVAAFVLLFLWKLFSEPWLEVSSLRTQLSESDGRNRKATADNKDLTAEIKDLTAEIKDLREHPRATTGAMQGSKIQATGDKPRCWLSSGRPVYHPQWSGPAGPMQPGTTINDMNITTEVVAFCNYRLDAPWQIVVDFDKPIVNGQLMVEAGNLNGGTRLIDPRLKENQFASGMTWPSIAPYAPMFVTVQTKGYVHAVNVQVAH
jgi:cell division protein FtsB